MNENKLQTFWVINRNDVPEYSSGQIVEYEGGWYPYDVFQLEDGRQFGSWFNTKEEAINDRVESLQTNLDILRDEYNSDVEEITKNINKLKGLL